MEEATDASAGQAAGLVEAAAPYVPRVKGLCGGGGERSTGGRPGGGGGASCPAGGGPCGGGGGTRDDAVCGMS